MNYSSIQLSKELCFFFQAEDGIRYAQESRGLEDVYKRQTILNGQQFGLLLIDAFPDVGKRLINDAVLAANAPGRFIQTRATTTLFLCQAPSVASGSDVNLGLSLIHI